tara:strand:+ start:3889 stop:4101 length:213 start_codon:yes stop_codon:yes gene_type:complete
MAIIETFVLLLMISDKKIEYTPYQSLSECLSVRRKIKRNVGHTNNFDQKWSCKRFTVKIEKNGEILEFVE